MPAIYSYTSITTEHCTGIQIAIITLHAPSFMIHDPIPGRYVTSGIQPHSSLPWEKEGTWSLSAARFGRGRPILKALLGTEGTSTVPDSPSAAFVATRHWISTCDRFAKGFSSLQQAGPFDSLSFNNLIKI